MEITAWKDGTQVTFVLDRETFDDMTALASFKIPIICTPSSHKNGMKVRLARLSKDLQLPAPDIIAAIYTKHYLSARISESS